MNHICVKATKNSLGHRNCIIRDVSLWSSCFPKMCAGELGNENPITPAMITVSWTPQNAPGLAPLHHNGHDGRHQGQCLSQRCHILISSMSKRVAQCFLHKPLACRAEGLTSSWEGSRAAGLCWEWWPPSLQGCEHSFSDILCFAVLHLLSKT